MKIYLYLNKGISDQEELTKNICSIIKRKGLEAVETHLPNKYVILKKGNDSTELQILVDSLQNNQHSYNLSSIFYANRTKVEEV